MLTGLLSMAQGAERVEGQFEASGLRINYLISLPEDYGAAPGKQWPLIFWLHGSEAQGNNVALLDGYYNVTTAMGRERLIIVLPQCPANTRWSTPNMLEVLYAFLDEVMAEYDADANRLYLAGNSLGGEGAWALSMAYPERFAAVVPVASLPYRMNEVCVLKDVPVWIFHSEKDTDCSPVPIQLMAETLEACGGDVKFALYPDLDHATSCVQAIYTPELYDWFLQHSLAFTNIRPGGKQMTM
jgi:predicted peptidase